MVYVYILKLINGKYYVGKTNNPQFRINAHKNMNGSVWTSKYAPISVERIISNCDDFDEDKYTIKYMEKYGIENVRGGVFSRPSLTQEEITMINRMITSSTNKCFRCNKAGHFAKDCPTLKIPRVPLKTIDNKPVKIFVCYKCNQTGHIPRNCNIEFSSKITEEKKEIIEEEKIKRSEEKKEIIEEKKEIIEEKKEIIERSEESYFTKIKNLLSYFL